MYESLYLFYLTVCQLILKEHNDACDLNQKHNISDFLVAVLWPTLALRLAGYIKYKNLSYH